jgi:hypothetical protein
MFEFTDVVNFFIEIMNNLKNGIFNFHSPLEEMVLKSTKDLAYVDNRKDAKEKYNYDLWMGLDKDWIKKQGIDERLLYSQSQQFPDFVFKAKRQNNRLVCGSLLELKDSRGVNIASFNSTIPTKYKSLEEVDIINGNNLVSRIAQLVDSEAKAENYCTYPRNCFYLIRTHKDTKKVKISLVDGSFFETVPKEHLFYQMFLNILRSHLEKKEIKISPEILRQVEELLSHITNQTIIASSQIIEKASIKPRLRIMAEVHPEGNPHSAFYPQIPRGSFNLILQASPIAKMLERELPQKVHGIRVFPIYHKRNGEHIVFSYSKQLTLT